MSTEFMPSRRIAYERIRAFSHNGVTAQLEDDDVLLSDGMNYLWVYPACAGRRITFCREGENDVERIVDVLEDFFRVRLVSEYDDEFHRIMKTERSLARRRKASASKKPKSERPHSSREK